LSLTILLGSFAGADEAERAARLHAGAIIVDTHLDVPDALRKKWVDLAQPKATLHVDLPRLKKGGLTAPFFAVYVPASFAKTGGAAREGLILSDLIDRVVAGNSGELVGATSVADIRAAKQAGKVAVLKGIEGGHVIENSLAVLRQFFQLGVRYMTLTHVNTNDWADSSGPFWEPDYDPRASVRHHGFSDFGRRVVAEMNRLGMAVDVSHVSDDVIRQALEISKAPIFASHSSCRSIADIPRNLTDEQIRAIGAKGGVVMVNVGTIFLDAEGMRQLRSFQQAHRDEFAAARAQHASDPKVMRAAMQKIWKSFKPYRTNLQKLVEHIEHALKLAPGGVGLGTDFDGIEDPPEGFEDVSFYPRLTEALLQRGHSEELVRGLLGENFLRFLSRVEETAARLRAEPADSTRLKPAAR
jgi:membrane dipeptidase